MPAAILIAFSLAGVAALAPAQTSRSGPGLSPGAKIPDFRLPDQNGELRTFADIRGPEGAMLVFYRSADW